MINGLCVLGWGVGGIEAEAAMLGQPISMLLPQVLGFRLDGELPEGGTATDLVLRVTEMLREKGVVGKFVEFYGPGLPSLGLADRATLGNMSPEFGSTCAIFPPDAETLRYLEFTGRPTEVIELVDAYTREQGLFHTADSEEPTFSDTLELDLGDVEPSIAGPKRPQDRIALTDSKRRSSRRSRLRATAPPPRRCNGARRDGQGDLPRLRPARRRRSDTRRGAARKPGPPGRRADRGGAERAATTRSRSPTRTARRSTSTTAAS